MTTIYPTTSQPLVELPKGLHLNDDCPICLDPFKAKAPDDHRTYREIAKTQCNHFFHQFCLQEHLTHGANTLCPICRGPALEYSVIDLDPAIKQEVLNRNKPPVQPKPHFPVQPQPEANVRKPNEENLGEDIAQVGGALLYGLGSLAYGIAKLGGSVLYHTAAAGANAVASSFIETTQQFDERVQKLYNKWAKTGTDLEAVMCKNREEVSLILSTIRSLPESSRYKARASVDKIEAAIATFETNLRDTQNNLKQIINEEKRNLSIRN
jgi:Ring finger domain